MSIMRTDGIQMVLKEDRQWKNIVKTCFFYPGHCSIIILVTSFPSYQQYFLETAQGNEHYN